MPIWTWRQFQGGFPKGRDCIERNFTRTFNCNATCEGIYADVEWRKGEDSMEMMKGKNSEILDRMGLLTGFSIISGIETIYLLFRLSWSSQFPILKTFFRLVSPFNIRKITRANNVVEENLSHCLTQYLKKCTYLSASITKILIYHLNLNFTRSLQKLLRCIRF